MQIALNEHLAIFTMPLNCTQPAKCIMNIQHIRQAFSQHSFVRNSVSFPLYRTQIQTFTDLFQDAHQSKLVKDLSSPSPAWRQLHQRVHEIGQVRSALVLWFSTNRKMWAQERVIKFKARSPRRKSWTRAARTLSSWGGVIYDFSQANKEEKWGKKEGGPSHMSSLHQERGHT